jgi:subtilisin
VRGVLHVAAAGNLGEGIITYPAKFASVIAVGATDIDNVRAPWSGTGRRLELVAPGVDINSTWPGGGYRLASGTSMASPHVAGTAALVIRSGTVTDIDGRYGIANEVRNRMNTTATDLGDPGWEYGHGLVNAAAAVVAPAPPPPPPPDDD